MKKLLRKISIIIITIVLCATASACSFIVKPPQGTIDNLPSSSILTESVIVSHYSNSERKLLSKVEAVEKTEKSVVCIETASGSGSGVIVDLKVDGDAANVYYVLTCHHVIAGGGSATVYALDDKGLNFKEEGYNQSYSYNGAIGGTINLNTPLTLVGGDQVSDIALLRINAPLSQANKLTKAKMIDTASNSVKRGDDVFCIGNPTGELPGSVTFGVVSYLNRQERFAESGLMTLIQTDAAIYPGSSGGAMFNLYGELVGITNGGNTEHTGINFAIPASNYDNNSEDRGFVNVSRQLLATYINAKGYNYGYVSGRWNLGIQVAQKEKDVNGAKSYYLEVVGIIDNSNSYLAGFMVGDIIEGVIYKYKGSNVSEITPTLSNFTTSFSFIRTLCGLGDSFTINIKRNETKLDLKVDIKVGGFIFMDTGIYPEANK